MPSILIVAWLWKLLSKYHKHHLMEIILFSNWQADLINYILHIEQSTTLHIFVNKLRNTVCDPGTNSSEEITENKKYHRRWLFPNSADSRRRYSPDWKYWLGRNMDREKTICHTSGAHTLKWQWHKVQLYNNAQELAYLQLSHGALEVTWLQGNFWETIINKYRVITDWYIGS